MRKEVASAVALTLLAIVWIFSAVSIAAEDAPRITKEEVKTLLNDPKVVILDARILSDWKKSDKKIKGAVRVDPHDVGAWAGNYSKEKKIIVYCS
jgi:rhodanese-related sulfurtransferase